MTAIVLALNRFHSVSLKPKREHFMEIFACANREGRLSVLLIVILGLALISYMALLFMVFQLGFSLQEVQAELEGRRRELTETEFKFQQASSKALLSEASGILASMEKVTSVKYIAEDESVALRPAR